MSVQNGEIIVCGQHTGGDVQLRIFGDEFYARYETLDGYTVVYDKTVGAYCYARLASGRFVSSGVPMSKKKPEGLVKHLMEDPEVRNEKFEKKYALIRPREIDVDLSASRTLGPDEGLLGGRKLLHGDVRGLTIIVDFDDVQSDISTDAVEAMFNGANYRVNGNYCSVKEYFQLMSSGKLNYTNTILGPVKLSKKRSHYINKLLVKEALDIAMDQYQIDLSDYDSRGEGIVDAINLLYAGNSQYSGNLWPHNSVARLRYGNFRTHYYQITGLGIRNVDLRIGTICHENGHLLCRFPDLYDYGRRDGDFEKSSGIGYYCLMGSGSHLNHGRTPAPVCGYLRELAGWVDEAMSLNSPGRFNSRHGDYNKLLKYTTNLPNEYFIIENKSKMGLDEYLPSTGLAVFHCDTLGSNEWQDGTRNKHYQLALLQADGHLDLENNRNRGDSTDLFQAVEGVALSDETMPSSRMWNGTDSGLQVSEIGEAGQEISFTVGQPVEKPMIEKQISPNLVIPDNNPEGVTSSINIDAFGEITEITVTVNIIHSWISDLNVALIAPDGTNIMLHNQEGEDGDDINQKYDERNISALADLTGSEMKGNWSLLVIDSASQDVGRLVSWGVRINYKTSVRNIIKTSNPNLQIPDHDLQGISDEIYIEKSGNLKRIVLELDIEHTYIGDLRIDLSSPSGTFIRLHNNEGGSKNNIIRSYDLASTSELAILMDEPIQGAWKLQVRDLAALDEGKLRSWSIELDY